MNGRVVLILCTLAAFGVLTGYAVHVVGYFGILAAGMDGWGAVQIFFDLVIVCALACVWMVGDGQRKGLNPWPYVAVTLLAGCFGPLLYLLRREWGETPAGS